MSAENIAEIKALAETQGKLLDTTKELKTWMEKANGEIETSKKMETETKAALEKISAKATELTDKCLELERKLSDGFEKHGSIKESLGAQFIKNEEIKRVASKDQNSYKMKVESSLIDTMEYKAAIINAQGQNQPLVPDMRVPGFIMNPNRIFTIRDLMPVGRTSSNMVQYTRELVYTNNAGPQYASPARENVTKNESGITFELDNAEVVTLAHWIPLSRQVLDDSPMLQSYVDGRLMYGLKLEEEDQLLNGNGVTGNMSGILNTGNNVDYNRSATGDTKLDTLRKSITQAFLSEYPVDTIVMNHEDWEEIELTKGTDGHYIFVNPVLGAGPQIWGRRVVPTNSIAAGTFLTGAFTMGAQIWDRMDASIKISYEDGNNFVKNMATLLAEERLALTVYRPAAFVVGAF